jgi:ubiquinone biosynthesis protein COQ4
MVGVLGETTGKPALSRMLKRMEQHPMGRAVLRDRPVITSTSMPIEWLRAMPSDSLGAAYAGFLQAHSFDPDERSVVQFVDDPDLAYVMTRYRQVHDLWHVLYALPPSLLGEVALKWLEAVQTGLPMCGLAAVGGGLRLKLKQRTIVRQHILPWVARQLTSRVDLMSVYYEREMEKPLSLLRQELGVELVPNVSQAGS